MLRMEFHRIKTRLYNYIIIKERSLKILLRRVIWRNYTFFSIFYRDIIFPVIGGRLDF